MDGDGELDLTGIGLELHEGVARLFADMREGGRERDEPVRSTFGLLGDRWSTLIVLVLGIGTWRHAELRRVLGRLGSEEKISQRVLTLKLRALERDGFVVRHVTGHVPPRVSYKLSEMGRELLDEAWRLIRWVRERAGAIEAARGKFDQREG